MASAKAFQGETLLLQGMIHLLSDHNFHNIRTSAATFVSPLRPGNVNIPLFRSEATHAKDIYYGIFQLR